MVVVIATDSARAEDTQAEGEAPAAAPVVEPDPAVDGPVYVIDEFRIAYVYENPGHAPIENVLAIAVTLTETDEGYIAPRENFPTVTRTLNELNARPAESYYASAVQRILEAVRDFYVKNDYLGVYIAPDPFQIDETGRDLREDNQQALTLLVTTGIVTEVRTVASGERVDPKNLEPEERINNPLHKSIIEDSPIQPKVEPIEGEATEDELEEMRTDLLQRNVLDRYLFHKSRHPGRRVDAAVAPAVEPGTISLDYMVTENRPLVLYFQLSNTGTKDTGYMRYRFGLFHTQITNSDDILSLDYSTNFDGTQSFTGGYDRPFDNDRVRWRVYGSWEEYSADEVGIFAVDFDGESWTAGGEIVANIYQDREFFIDLFGGVRWYDTQVNNEFVGEGEEDFIFPYVGLRFDKTTEWYSGLAETRFEFQDEGLSGVDEDELVLLGRADPDEDWVVFSWDASYSVYLEPLFDYDRWANPASGHSTLAHELLFRTNGIYSFGARLIPQIEAPIGGLYTVRGYPESITAGDTVAVGSIEYRYHIPKDFGVEVEPRELFGEPFRWAPQYAYGRPDWDFVLKAFVDVGRSVKADRQPFETNETLIGAGIGFEFLYRRNVNIRVDWGVALEDTNNGITDAGSNRIHFVATFLF